MKSRALKCPGRRKRKMTEIRKNTASLILEAVAAGVMRKAVLSKPTAPDEIKTELSPIKIGEKDEN